MITKELLDLLVCPETRTPLALADAAIVDRLNKSISKGRVTNKAGQAVTTPVAGALVSSDETLVYPIVDNIPLLLADEGILLAQLED